MQSSKGCVRLLDALKCIGMHLGGHCYSRVELLTSKCAEMCNGICRPVGEESRSANRGAFLYGFMPRLTFILHSHIHIDIHNSRSADSSFQIISITPAASVTATAASATVT